MAKEHAALRAASGLAAAAAVLAAFAAWRWGLAEPVRAEARPAGPAAPLAAGPGPQLAVPAGVSAAVPGSPALQQVGGNLTVLSDVAEAAVQSVVNISTTKISQRLLSDEERMFRRFWGLRGGDRDETRATSLGSGVIVSADGIVLTNNHVVEGATAIQVKLADGRELSAKLVGADPRADLAVLRLQGNPTAIKPIALADSDKVRLGEVVLAIGSPFGLAQSVSMGIVSAKGRADVHIADYEDFIQTDAAINPGNSGGALVDVNGNLIGINSAIYSPNGGSLGIGFAIPVSTAKKIMEQIIQSGSVTRGWIGVAVQEITPELAESFKLGNTQGVLISEVVRGSPADKAGIKAGDILTSVADKALTDSGSMLETISALAPGKTVLLKLLRNQTEVAVQVKVGKRPRPKPQE